MTDKSTVRIINEERKRLMSVIYNAIVIIQEHAHYDKRRICVALGISEDLYDTIMEGEN